MGRTTNKNTKDKKDTSDGSGSESEAEYVVEKIVNRRVKNGKVIICVNFLFFHCTNNNYSIIFRWNIF